ncbi:MAG: pyridoxal-phosphate dependent enzyme [Myxococcota bacterium]|nr:pyridoxal-phosphate dependent enzyme [Myxococcota bacterium]
MSSSPLALFRALPDLEARIPRRPCLTPPTPVEPLALAGHPAGLWVKRDDRSTPRVGGNKPRKLEFVLGAALARGARRLVTTGALGTNHGLATTILGRDAGLATTLVLIGQPVTASVKRALLLDAAWGAELVWGGNLPGAAAQTLRVLARSTLRGERPYLVATGGSSRRGNLGFVSAALELAEQVREGACPAPAQIYVPVGTGGTLVGLLAGLALTELPTRVVGVLVTDILPPSQRRLQGAARGLLAWLAKLAPAGTRLPLEPAGCEIVSRQRGGGYGAPTPAAHEALCWARELSLSLETTYTGKCLAEILERAREGALPDAPVLFWNTFNSVDLAASAPRPLDPALLPRRFQRFLDEPDAPAPGLQSSATPSPAK